MVLFSSSFLAFYLVSVKDNRSGLFSRILLRPWAALLATIPRRGVQRFIDVPAAAFYPYLFLGSARELRRRIYFAFRSECGISDRM